MTVVFQIDAANATLKRLCDQPHQRLNRALVIQSIGPNVGDAVAIGVGLAEPRPVDKVSAQAVGRTQAGAFAYERYRNARADDLCQSHNLLGIGGSDAHLTSHIATCMTDFEADIRNESNLVDALLGKAFQPVWLKDIVNGASGS